MSLLDKLEKRLRPVAVPNLTVMIIVSQMAAMLMIQSGTAPASAFLLIPRRVSAGEWWRVLSFVLNPPFRSPLAAFFGWYLFFIMGTALERYWGDARYNLYLLIGYAATVAAAFLAPDAAATSAFIGGSVFLAFAHLCPEFELLLFFILPVKIKWLALLTWIGYGMTLVSGPAMARALVLASTANYLAFFGRDILRRARSGHKRMAAQARRVAASGAALHQCCVCGVTDRSDPDMEFRYCTQCKPTRCYCLDHLAGHEHVVEPPARRT